MTAAQVNSINCLETITKIMHRLEVEINREQAYISKHGKNNDQHTDGNWESYKYNAQLNLQKWDLLKARRDELKAK